MTAAVVIIHIGEHQDFVNILASRVWSKYRDFVEFDDLQQEAALWWYSKGQAYLAEYLEDDHRSRLSVAITRNLVRYAEKEKAARSGYRPQDQYRYNPREVLDLIPVALDPDGLPAPGHLDGGPAPKGNLAEGGDVLAALVDVRRALAALTEDDIQFLTLVDDCQGDWERVAARLADGVQPDSLRRRHARIAERMARWLSKEEDL